MKHRRGRGHALKSRYGNAGPVTRREIERTINALVEEIEVHGQRTADGRTPVGVSSLCEEAKVLVVRLKHGDAVK